MKYFKRFTAILCVLVLCFSMFAVSAEAATKFAALSSGKTVTLKTEYVYDANYNRSETAHYYKLTLKADSVVKFKWSGKAAKTWIDIYADSAMKKHVKIVEGSSKASGTASVALGKGTYYIDMYDGYSNSSYTPSAKVTVTVTPVTKINKSNYSRAKAIALKAGNTVTIAQTPYHDYSRWYKITLTKNQKITVTTNGYVSVNIYSSKLVNQSTNYSSGKYVTKDKLAKGTYYIRVGAANYFSNDCLGEYITLKWK